MDDSKDDKAVKTFLQVLGGIIITTGFSPIGRALVEGHEYKIGPAIAIIAPGLIVLCSGLFWNYLRPASDNKFTRTLADIATNPSWWLGTIFIVGFTC
jgi:hypothetical protein